MAETTIESVLSQAITDFDSIYASLKDKGVTYSGKELNSDTTGVKTSEYADLIKTELYRVGNRLSLDEGTDGTKIKDLKTLGAAGGNSTIASSDNTTFTVSFKPSDAGFVGKDTNVTISITAQNPSLSSNATLSDGTGVITSLTGDDDVATGYKVTADSGKILGSVTIPTGSISIPDPSVTHTISVTPNVGVAASTTGITSKIKSANDISDLTDDEKAKYIQFDMSAGAKYTDNLTATITPKLSNGFITGFSDTNFDATNTSSIVFNDKTENKDATNVTSSFYLPIATIENLKLANTATIEFADPNAATVGLLADANSEEGSYYLLDADVTGLALDSASQITEGWTSGTSLKIDSTSAKASGQTRIKKGSLTAGEVSMAPVVTDTDSITTAEVAEKDAANYYTVSVSAKDALGKVTVQPGFIVDKEADVTAKFPTQDIHVAKGTVETSVLKPTAAYDNSIIKATLATTDVASDYYTITPTVSAKLSRDKFTEGYVKATKETSFNGTIDPFYVKKGKVSFTHGLTVTTPTGVEQLFKEVTADEKAPVDSFKVSTSGTLSVDSGYVVSGDNSFVTETTDKEYYIPKAVVEWVSNGTEGAKLVQVKSGGYITSGSIAVTDGGSIDYAAVKALLDTGTTSILSTTGKAGDYKINLTKSSGTDAGYISATEGEGTVELGADYYIPKGNIILSASIGNINIGTVPTYDDTGKSYTFNATTTGNATVLDTTEYGYVTASDVKIEQQNAGEATGTLTLKSIGLSVTSDGKSTVGVDLGGLAAGTGTTDGYEIKPTFTAGTFTANVTSDGYGTVGKETASQVADATQTSVFIKKGDAVSIAPTAKTKLTLADNFSATQAGDYTVSVSTARVTGNAAVADGYYKAVTATANIPVEGSISVAHGNAAIGITSASTDVDLGGMTATTPIETTEADKTARYYKISGSVSNINLNKSVTQGYVKDSDVILNNGAAGSVTQITKYIKKYEWNGDGGQNTAVATASDTSGTTTKTYFVPYGNSVSSGVFGSTTTDLSADNQDTLVLNTAGTYAANDIKLTLNADAAGKNVRASILRLQQRLAGELARTTV